jgi:hypothetical protein
MINNGLIVGLNSQTPESPPGNDLGSYGRFHGYFHPTGTDPTTATEQVAQNTANPPATSSTQNAAANPPAVAARVAT